MAGGEVVLIAHYLQLAKPVTLPRVDDPGDGISLTAHRAPTRHRLPRQMPTLSHALLGECDFAKATMNCTNNASHEICFRSLFKEGRALSFPCDEAGRVHLDALSERARENYLYARAVVGREFAFPCIRVAMTH